MKVLISGARGFIGRPLAEFFSAQGHTVVKLIRSETAQKESEPFKSIFWNPEEGRTFSSDFEGFDAVIHLAGEPLSLGRWTRGKKEKILLSRTVGTRALSQVLAQLSRPPQIFLSASAIGYYGNRGEEELTEESSSGEGFLADVCREWEEASQSLEDRGVRVVSARFGMVIGPDGGAVQKMIFPYKLGLGGRLGSGKQWVSWIDREDLMRAIDHILQHSSLKSAVNIVTPYPVRQKEFAEMLAGLLHRPALGSMPGWLLRLLFGQMADEMLLSSAKVYPSQLLDSGFVFRFPHLIDSLNKVLAG